MRRINVHVSLGSVGHYDTLLVPDDMPEKDIEKIAMAYAMQEIEISWRDLDRDTSLRRVAK